MTKRVIKITVVKDHIEAIEGLPVDVVVEVHYDPESAEEAHVDHWEATTHYLPLPPPPAPYVITTPRSGPYAPEK